MNFMLREILLCSIILGIIDATFGSSSMTRVVNGSDTDILEFPFMVSVKGDTDYHICGGSIISEEWIMTAGHCINLTLYDVTQYSVQYGVTQITKEGDTVIRVKNIIVHEDFALTFLDNDIALLQLESPIEFGPNAQPVQLPYPNAYTSDGTNAIVLGWGMNGTFDGQYQQTLQKADLKILTAEVCDRFHSRVVEKYNICAGIPEGGKGQCTGDSGGPLLHNDIQIGIVSWSMKPCTISPYPGVFTLVSYFRNWITNKTGI